MLDGLGKLDKLIDRAKSFDMDALAITDHGAMYGSFKFYLKAIAAGIKPIIGVETYVAKRSRFDKEAKVDTDPYHLVLLAKNEVGYKNLMKLVTHAHLEGYYYRPRIDWELLQQHADGLICLSACLQGQVSNLLRNNQDNEAETVARQYAQLFGPDHYYIELQRHPAIADCDVVNEKLVALARKLGLPLVATNDIHYVDADDAEAQEILLCVQTQHTILEKNRPLTMIDSPDFYMRSPREMQELFVQYPEAIENTVKIAAMCNLTLSVGKWILPNYPLEAGVTPEAYLKKLVEERTPARYKKLDDEAEKRIAYELDIICTKGYATYFLIVQDFVNWAKSQGISVGPGRGSAAGSMVTYILGITGLDPLYFNLPFERFLNPFRPSAPDIDLDFADDRRDEVIAYVTKRFGEDKVAQIVTFGTMEARGAVRDAGRALGMPYAAPDRISKMIPPGFQGGAMTIEKALDQSPELARAYQTEPETKRLLDVATKLEGVARHSSVHAAGVVIADKPLVEYTPLQRESKGDRIVTQYDMYTVGEDGVGLLKMDFLGLRNLTIMSQALAFIKKVRGVTIDLDTIALDDKKTYELLSSGETTGIFQLESSGMRRYIKDLRPTSIFDVMAMVALFRPGPMQVIPEFIRRKQNPEYVTYPDPRLKDVLRQSYGIICYQDDVLLTAITVAGYSWGDADKLRKAVGKKIPSEMKKQKEKFIDGCVKNGLTKSKAEHLFTLIEPFAGYGFNKAHAACYAMIAYQTGYLKANFQVEFMTAVLAAESRSNTGTARDEKIGAIVNECRRINLTLLPPDINRSGVEFEIEAGAIRFGLSAIKNVGTSAIESIIAARQSGGFTSLSDVINRVDISKANRKTFESMIKAGAFDQFGNRASQLAALPTMLEQIHKLRRSTAAGQVGLFDGSGEQSVFENPLPNIEELSPGERLSFEKELLGFYLTAHPLQPVLDQLDRLNATKIEHITKDRVGEKVVLGGIVTTVKRIVTKSTNQEMAFVRLEDLSGTIEIIIFPKIYARTLNFWNKDMIIVVSGRIDEKEDRLLILVDEARSLL
ncbi:DNA polymerase III subunit alpha [Candidatus Gottesmanbacteria bacterium RIFCSPHIGHO2_01_FULL_46_14]|uniref:DNA polymerase III subunit alpha n=2 Tax=Candidatus Gottesmaniibacteriota TaxID=1752720 RepID=A0A1F5ZL22_9BACT|nr:MAG: DNA polymerase III subunit alpha [Candidatus Gottesmanbacteria bacterium RIFCSPHIGHO2_01_FULL_46_14]OGG29030.1 MAG: DNA polymerase III subunit alpha [Candidatus Gottesmanbacteria bacterium RIFCSPLOWO2_01_FULL_46_21]